MWSGSVTTSLAVALFFELLWLDTIPVGTFIPPAALFPTIASLILIKLFGLIQPSEILVVLMATMPWAACMAWLDTRQRLNQNKAFNRLVLSTRRGGIRSFAPEISIHKGIFYALIRHGFASLAILCLLAMLISYVLPVMPRLTWLSWPYLWLAASLGGVAAMRFRYSYLFLTTGVAGVATLVWLGLFL